jgi:DNA-binding MarR family transcriptional regulator
MAGAPEFREAITRLYQRFNALQRGEKRCFGVTMSQCVTLEFLQQEGPKTVCDLANGLGLDTSTVTRVVDVLVRDGLLRRVRDEKQDRRRVFVSLTERGRRLAEKLQACADDYCERILSRVPRSRRDEVLQALSMLADAIDELPNACC